MTKRPPPPDLGSFRPLGDEEPERPTRRTAPHTEPPRDEDRRTQPALPDDDALPRIMRQTGPPRTAVNEPRGNAPGGGPATPRAAIPRTPSDLNADMPRTVSRRKAPPPDAAYARHVDAPEPRRWGRIVGLSLLGLIALVVAGVGTLLAFPPTTLVRDRLIQEVRARTGRDIAITGATKFSVLPKLSVSMAGVTVSPPPGMAGAPVLTMASLDAEVRLWPMIMRDIVIDRLVLRQPVIDLRIDAGGRKSWDFAGGTDPLLPPLPVRYAQAGGKDLAKDLKALPKEVQDFVKGAADAPGKDLGRDVGRSAASRLDNLTLSDVRIENGSLRYTDERSGLTESVTGLDATLTAKSLASPLEAIGRFTWSGELVDFNARATPFRAVLEDKPAQVVAVAKSAKLDAAYDGLVILGQDTELDGKMTAKVASIAEAARWAGVASIPPLPGAFDFSGHVRHAANVTTVSDATVRLDKVAAAGSVSVDTKGARPFIKGAVRFADLDLNTFVALADGAASAPAIKPRATAPVTPASGAAPRSIEDLLRDGASPKKQVRGFTRRDGWSDDELDLTAAGLVDTDLKIAFNKFAYKELATGTGQVTLGLKNKVARLTIDDVQLYEGRGRGLVTLDATNATAVLGSNVTLDGVSTGAFLKDLAAFPWLSGKAKISLAVAGQGKTERQIIQTLNGKADIVMGLGALTGIDISEILRGLAQGRLASIEHNPAKKTDFSDLGGSIAITNGIAQNNDFRVTSAAVRATGAGAIDLPQRSLNYTLRPKVTGSGGGADSGQGFNLSGLDVPVKITGGWDKPTVTPDVGSAVKEFAKTPQGKEVEDTVKGILGGDPAAQQKAKDFLNRFLKQ